MRDREAQWTYSGVPCVGAFSVYPVVKRCLAGTTAGPGVNTGYGRDNSGSKEEGEGLDVGAR